MFVSSTERYRNLGRTEISPDDIVLEVGCSSGEATRLLCSSAAQVVAVDISEEMVDRVRANLGRLSNLRVERVDARDAPRLASVCPSPTVIFLDVGGNAPLPNVTVVLRGLLMAYRPRLVVVRSQELADMYSLVTEVEAPSFPESSPAVPPARVLLELSRSLVVSDRLFAVLKLKALGTQEADARLTELEGDPNAQVRRAARLRLGQSD